MNSDHFGISSKSLRFHHSCKTPSQQNEGITHFFSVLANEQQPNFLSCSSICLWHNMVRLAATLASIGGIAVTLSGCGSTDYNAQETCTISHCTLPNVKAGCCEMFRMIQQSAACNMDQTCIDRQSSNEPQGLRQWAQTQGMGVPGGNFQQACPGIMAGMSNPASCSASAELMELPSEDQVWELAQWPAPEPKAQSQWVLGLIGFTAGAAVVTAVVAFKKKRIPSELYAPLYEVTA